jgi:hypothetical protein
MNNIIKQKCPDRMSDGRHFTDYRRSSDITNIIIEQNNIKDSYSLKNFLVNNGNNIRQTMSNFYAHKNYYDPTNFYHIDFEIIK